MKLSLFISKILSAVIFLQTSSCLHVSKIKVTKADLSTKEIQNFFSALPNNLNLENQRGEITIYKIFAPWCHSCLHEIAMIENHAYSYRMAGLDFKFLSTEPIDQRDFPVFQSVFLPEVVESLGITQVPQTYVFKNKKLIQTFSRPLMQGDFDAMADLANKNKRESSSHGPAAPS